MGKISGGDREAIHGHEEKENKKIVIAAVRFSEQQKRKQRSEHIQTPKAEVGKNYRLKPAVSWRDS